MALSSSASRSGSFQNWYTNRACVVSPSALQRWILHASITTRRVAAGIGNTHSHPHPEQTRQFLRQSIVESSQEVLKPSVSSLSRAGHRHETPGSRALPAASDHCRPDEAKGLHVLDDHDTVERVAAASFSAVRRWRSLACATVSCLPGTLLRVCSSARLPGAAVHAVLSSSPASPAVWRVGRRCLRVVQIGEQAFTQGTYCLGQFRLGFGRQGAHEVSLVSMRKRVDRFAFGRLCGSPREASLPCPLWDRAYEREHGAAHRIRRMD